MATITAEATETKATALIATIRTKLAIGGSVRGQDLKDMLAQLESATTNDLSARTNVTPNEVLDGRSTAETAAIS